MRVALIVAALLAAACTQPQRDHNAREWAKAECNRMIDGAERERCLKRIEDQYGRDGERREPPKR